MRLFGGKFFFCVQATSNSVQAIAARVQRFQIFDGRDVAFVL